jgi:hypothetical protein
LRQKIVIPENSVGSGVGFGLSESHVGKELANAAITKLALVGSGLIESVSNGFDRKDAIFYLSFEPYDNLHDLRFEVEGLGFGIKFWQFLISYVFYFLPEELFGFRGFSHLLLKLDGFEGVLDSGLVRVFFQSFDELVDQGSKFKVQSSRFKVQSLRFKDQNSKTFIL